MLAETTSCLRPPGQPCALLQGQSSVVMLGLWRMGAEHTLGKADVQALVSLYLALSFSWSGCSPERRMHCPSGASQLKTKEKKITTVPHSRTQLLPLPLLKLLPCEREDAGGLRPGVTGADGLLKGLCGVWIQAICFQRESRWVGACFFHLQWLIKYKHLPSLFTE